MVAFLCAWLLFGICSASSADTIPETIAPVVTPGGLAGHYCAFGTNPNGSTYTGHVLIAQRGRAVRARWEVKGAVYGGFGLITGDHVSIGYGLEDGSGVAAVYRIDETGLMGEWTDTDGDIGQERLVPGECPKPSVVA